MSIKTIRPLNTQPMAEQKLMEVFGLDSHVVEWIKSTALETLNELKALDCPPLMAQVMLAYAQHLAGAMTDGMGKNDVATIAFESRQLLSDVARWHMDQIDREMRDSTGDGTAVSHVRKN